MGTAKELAAIKLGTDFAHPAHPLGGIESFRLLKDRIQISSQAVDWARLKRSRGVEPTQTNVVEPTVQRRQFGGIERIWTPLRKDLAVEGVLPFVTTSFRGIEPEAVGKK